MIEKHISNTNVFEIPWIGIEVYWMMPWVKVSNTLKHIWEQSSIVIPPASIGDNWKPQIKPALTQNGHSKSNQFLLFSFSGFFCERKMYIFNIITTCWFTFLHLPLNSVFHHIVYLLDMPHLPGYGCMKACILMTEYFM